MKTGRVKMKNYFKKVCLFLTQIRYISQYLFKCTITLKKINLNQLSVILNYILTLNVKISIYEKGESLSKDFEKFEIDREAVTKEDSKIRLEGGEIINKKVIKNKKATNDSLIEANKNQLIATVAAVVKK